MKTLFSLVAYTVLAGLLWSAPVLAGSGYDNSAALKGVSRAQVYFDVSLKDAETLLGRMDLVERTLTQLDQDGVDVEAVVGFRAGASRYITSGEHYVLDEDIATKLKIAEWINSFAKNGVTIEQCSIAAKQQGIDPADFLPEVTVVKNGFVSLVGYQSRGFAVIPMD